MKSINAFACEKCGQVFTTRKECSRHEQHCTEDSLLEDAIHVTLKEDEDFPGTFTINTEVFPALKTNLGKVSDYTHSLHGWVDIELSCYVTKDKVKEVVRTLVSQAKKNLTKRRKTIDTYKSGLDKTYKEWWKEYSASEENKSKADNKSLPEEATDLNEG